MLRFNFGSRSMYWQTFMRSLLQFRDYKDYKLQYNNFDTNNRQQVNNLQQ